METGFISNHKDEIVDEVQRLKERGKYNIGYQSNKGIKSPQFD